MDDVNKDVTIRAVKDMHVIDMLIDMTKDKTKEEAILITWACATGNAMRVLRGEENDNTTTNAT